MSLPIGSTALLTTKTFRQWQAKKKIWNPQGKAALRRKRLLARKVLETIGSIEFKPENSAKWVNVTKHWNGSIRVQIQHDTLKGVTPEMMKWFFENQAKTTTWNGVDFSGEEVVIYHLWHHRDHVAIKPLTNPKNGINNGFAVGAYTVIQEQFNDYHEMINNKMLTITLDETEFTFHIKKFGLTVGKVVHYYSPTPDGIDFYAETHIGIEFPIFGWLMNWLLLPFYYSKKTAAHWIKHNIEETGQSEKIIPILFHQAKK